MKPLITVPFISLILSLNLLATSGLPGIPMPEPDAHANAQPAPLILFPGNIPPHLWYVPITLLLPPEIASHLCEQYSEQKKALEEEMFVRQFLNLPGDQAVDPMPTAPPRLVHSAYQYIPRAGALRRTSVHFKRARCIFCDQLLPGVQKLKQHERFCEQSTYKHECKKCGAKFETQYGRVGHQRACEGPA